MHMKLFLPYCICFFVFNFCITQISTATKTEQNNMPPIDIAWGIEEPQLVFLSPGDTASFYLNIFESEHCQNPQIKIAEIIDSAGFKLTEFPFVRGEKKHELDRGRLHKKKFIVKATDSIKPGEYRIYFRIEGTAENKEGVKCTIVNNGGSNYLPPSLKGKGYKWVTIFYGIDPRQKKN